MSHHLNKSVRTRDNSSADSSREKDIDSAAVFRFGSPSELNGVVPTYRAYLINVARQTLPVALESRFDASDLVQDTLERGIRRRKQFRGSSSHELRGWLRKILVNLISDLLRRRGRKGEQQSFEQTADSDVWRNALGREASPSSNVKHQERRCSLDLALQKLPQQQQLVVKLRSEGLSYREVGEKLGISEDAAGMNWRRAIDKLVGIVHLTGNR